MFGKSIAFQQHRVNEAAKKAANELHSFTMNRRLDSSISPEVLNDHLRGQFLTAWRYNL
jgi:hypothetical protein